MAKQLNIDLSVKADTSQAAQSLAKLQQQLSQLGNTSISSTNVGLTAEINKASMAALQLKTNLQAATNAETGKLDLSKFTEQLNKSGMSLKQYKQQLSVLGADGEKAFVNLAQSVAMAEIPLRRTNTLAASLWTSLKNTARWQLSSTVLHGFMSTISGAYHYAQDLNKSLNNIRIVTGQTTEQMAKFAEYANKSAQALSTTTTAYTNAALIFYQQGLKGQDVTDRTDVAIKLANVTGQTAEDISNQMTAIWNNFDDGSESLEHYADVITNLGAHTASSSKEIAEGLGKFAAIGKTVGLSYDYATTALATVVAQTRQSADTVGTAFKTIFSRLEQLKQGGTTEEDGTTLGQYSQALLNVGVNIKDANGQLKDMDQILDETGAKWKNLGRDQQIALAQSVAGIRQYQQFIALMDNYDTFQSNLSYATDADGSLQRQAETYAESWESAQKRVKAAAQDIYAALLNDDFFIDLTNGFSNFLKDIKNVIDGLGGVKGVLLTLGTIVTQVFQKQIADSMSSLAYSMKMSTNAGRQALIDKKVEASNLLANDAVNKGSISGSMQSEAYKKLSESQINYAMLSDKMNESDRQSAELILQRNKLLADGVISLGQQVDEEEEALALETKRIAQQTGRDITTWHVNGKNLVDEAQKQGRLNVADVSLSGAMKGLTSAGAGTEASTTALKTLQSTIANIETGYKQAEVSLEEAFGPKAAQLFKTLKTLANDSSTSITEINDAYQAWTNEVDTSGSRIEEVFSTFKERLVEIYSEQISQANPGLSQEEIKTQAMEKAGQVADDLKNKYIDLGNKEGELANKTGGLSNSVDQANKKFHDFANASLTASQALTQIASTLMSIGMLINSINGLIDTWNNKDADLKTKITTTLTTLGILVPTLIKVISGFKDAATATVTFGTTMSVAMWQVTLIVAAIAALVAIFVALGKAAYANSPEGVLKNTKEAANEAADAAEKAKQAYDDLADSLNNLETGLDKIEDLTVGTLEWRKAIIDSNNDLMTLLSTYGMLSKENYTIDENGIMRLADGVEDQLKEKALAQMESTQAAAWGAQAAVNRASSRNEASKTAGELTLFRSNGSDVYDALGENTQFSADVGMALAEAINNGSLTDVGSEEQLIEALTGVGDLTEQECELLAGQITASDELQTSLYTLSDKVNANTQANAALNEQTINAQFGDQISAKDLTDAGKEALTSIMANGLDEQAEDLYQTKWKDKGLLGGGITDEAVQKLYAEKMGYAIDTIENQDGNKAKYYNVDGSEVGVISDEVARRFLAQQEALQAVGDSIDNYTDTIKEVVESGNKIAEGVGDALSSFIGGQGGDVSSLSKSSYEALAKSLGAFDSGTNSFTLGDQTIDDTAAQAAGYKDAKAYYNAVKGALDKVDWNSLTLPEKEIIPADELSYETAQKLSTAYTKAINGALGKEGGDAFIDGVSKMLDGVSDEDMDAALDGLLNIDWSAWDAGEQAQAVMENLGYQTNMTAQEWSDFVETMRHANNAIPDFSTLKQDLTSIYNIVKGLDFGSIIDEKAYNTLIEYNAALKDLFILMADGKYKFIGDSDDIHAATMSQLKDELSVMRERAEINDTFSKSVTWSTTDSKGNKEALNWSDVAANSDKYNLDTLGENILGSSSTMEALEGIGYSAERVKEIFSDTTNNVDQIETLAQALNDLGESGSNSQQLEEMLASTATNVTELDKLFSDGSIGIEAYTKAYSALDEASTLDGLDSKQVSEYSKHLQQIANSSDLVDDSLSGNAEAAEDVAAAVMRMNRGVTSLSTNFKGWNDVLKKSDKSSQEYFESLDGLREAMSDVLGVSGDYLSESFLTNTENMDLMAQAAKGSAEAIDELAKRAGRDIVANIAVNNDLSADNVAEVMSQFDAMQAILDDKDLKVGATLDDASFQEAAQELINTAGMTVDEANAMFDALGYEANFATEEQDVPQTVPEIVTERKITAWDDKGNPTKWTESSYQDGTKTFTGKQTVFAMETSKDGKKVPKINSITKKSSGAMNNSSSANPGKTGGGGNSSKVERKGKDYSVDRYKEVDDNLEDISQSLEEANKQTSRLYGASAISNLNRVNDLLEKQIKYNRDKLTLAKSYLEVDRATLQTEASRYGLQFQFDADNDIINYTATMIPLQEQLNAELEKYNQLYGETLNSEAAKQYEEKNIKPLQAKISALTTAINKYEETKKIVDELTQTISELNDTIQDNNYQKITIQLEYKTAGTQSALDLIDTKINLLQNDVYKMGETFKLMSQELPHQKTLYDEYSAAVTKLKRAYEDEDISKSDYINGLKDNYKNILSTIKAYKDLDNEMMNYYGETLSAISDKLSYYTDQMDHLNTVLDHYKEILALTNSEENKALTLSILQAKSANSKNQYNASLETYNMYKNQRAEIEKLLAAATTDAEKEMYTKQLEEIVKAETAAEEDLLAKRIQHINDLKDEWKEALSQIADEYEDTLSGVYDSLQSILDLMNLTSTRSDIYLTKTNQIYETNKMLRDLQKNIDATDNKVAKQRLNNFGKEIEAAQQKNALSQLELQILQAKYKQLEAQIALEEAQNAKQTVTLQRDSEGNYGYVYTANQEAVGDAQQAVDDAANELYNLRLQAANEYLEKTIQLEQEVKNAIKEIWEDETLTYEEKLEKDAAIRDEYYQLMTAYQDQYAIATEEDARIIEDAWTTEYANVVLSTEEWKDKTEEYSKKCQEATQASEKKVSEFNTQATKDYGNISNKTKEVTQKSEELSKTITNTEIPAMKSLFASINETTKAYAAQREQLLKNIETMKAYAEELNATIGTESGKKEKTKSSGGSTKAQWYQDDVGWWYGTKDASGKATSWAQSGWAQDDKGDWYYFNDKGYMETPDANGQITVKEADGKTYKWTVNAEHNGTYGAWIKDSAPVAVDGGNYSGNYQKSTTIGNPGAGSSSKTSNKIAAAWLDEDDELQYAAEGWYKTSTGNKWYTNGEGEYLRADVDSGDTYGWYHFANEGKYYKFNKSGFVIDEKTEEQWKKDMYNAQGELKASAEKEAIWYNQEDDLDYYDTGGYTGAWGSSGKLAVLHEKELVLNEEDTKNILGVVGIVRDIVQAIDLAANWASGGIGLMSAGVSSTNDILEQNVTITAEFPNATDRNEIEEAFNNLINHASQYANRK